jgi:hypothetical protein
MAGIHIFVLGLLFGEFLLITLFFDPTLDACAVSIFFSKKITPFPLLIFSNSDISGKLLEFGKSLLSSLESFSDGKALADGTEGAINDFFTVLSSNEVAVSFNWDSFLFVIIDGSTFPAKLNL